MTTNEITVLRQTIAALPELPVVFAASMMIAQGYRPSKSELAAIAARREFFRSMGMSLNVNVDVRGRDGGTIGQLVFPDPATR